MLVIKRHQTDKRYLTLSSAIISVLLSIVQSFSPHNCAYDCRNYSIKEDIVFKFPNCMGCKRINFLLLHKIFQGNCVLLGNGNCPGLFVRNDDWIKSNQLLNSFTQGVCCTMFKSILFRQNRLGTGCAFLIEPEKLVISIGSVKDSVPSE